MNFYNKRPPPYCINEEFREHSMFYDLYCLLWIDATNESKDFTEMEDKFFEIKQIFKQLCIEDRDKLLNILKEDS
jgi:hypothetical protein